MGHAIDCSVIDTLILQDESDLESVSFMYPEGKLLFVSAELNLPSASVNTGYLIPIELTKQIIELLLSDQLSSGAEEMVAQEASGDDVAAQETEIAVDDEPVGGSDGFGADGIQLDDSEIPLVFEDAAATFVNEVAPQVRDLQPAAFEPNLSLKILARDAVIKSQISPTALFSISESSTACFSSSMLRLPLIYNPCSLYG
jgi:hypothetical protein